MTLITRRQGRTSLTLLVLIAAMALLPIWMVGSYSAQSAANEERDRAAQTEQIRQAEAEARQMQAQARRAEDQARRAEDQVRKVEVQIRRAEDRARGVEAELQYFDTQASQFRNRQVPTQQFQSQQIQTRRIHNVGDDPYADRASRPGVSTQYRPVTETEFREKKTVISVPHVDPKTGKATMREEEQVIRYPVQTTRWVTEHSMHSGAMHHQKAMQLAAELRAMPKDDKSRENKLKQLRKQLEIEFKELHSQQLAQIDRTAERLETLKKLHDQRGENKKKIVDRRMDELLGKVDPLGWNPAPIHVPQAMLQPATTITIPGQPSRVGQPTRKRFGFTVAPSLPGAAGIYAPAPIGIPGPPHVPGFKAPKPPQPPMPESPKDRAAIRKREPTVRVEVIEKKVKEVERENEFELEEDVEEDVDVEVEVDAQPSDAATLRSTTRNQVATPRSTLGDVFRLARAFAEARAESASSEMELQQIDELRRKGAIPMLEFQKAELELSKSKRELKLLGMELDALTEAMQRVQKVAKSMLRRAEQNRNAVMVGHTRGTHSDQDVASANFDVEKARVELEDASANLSRLIETMATVKSFDADREQPNALDETQGDEEESVDEAEGEETEEGAGEDR